MHYIKMVFGKQKKTLKIHVDDQLNRNRLYCIPMEDQPDRNNYIVCMWMINQTETDYILH